MKGFSEKVHRERDLELDNLWRNEHDAGECGGAEGYCYICCKKKLFGFTKKILENFIESYGKDNERDKNKTEKT